MRTVKCTKKKQNGYESTSVAIPSGTMMGALFATPAIQQSPGVVRAESLTSPFRWSSTPTFAGPADKDRACMKALLIPGERMMFLSIAADGAPSYKLGTLDDGIARVKARGHAMLEEKQLKFRICVPRRGRL
jgi:hypothetical protein